MTYYTVGQNILKVTTTQWVGHVEQIHHYAKDGGGWDFVNFISWKKLLDGDQHKSFEMETLVTSLYI